MAPSSPAGSTAVSGGSQDNFLLSLTLYQNLNPNNSSSIDFANVENISNPATGAERHSPTAVNFRPLTVESSGKSVLWLACCPNLTQLSHPFHRK
jgi:hypothetical protein